MAETLKEALKSDIVVIATLASPYVALPKVILEGEITEKKLVVIRELEVPSELIDNKVFIAFKDSDVELFKTYLLKCSDVGIMWMDSYMKGKLAMAGFKSKSDALSIGEKLITLKNEVEGIGKIYNDIIVECVNGVELYKEVQLETNSVELKGITTSYASAIFVDRSDIIAIKELAI